MKEKKETFVGYVLTIDMATGDGRRVALITGITGQVSSRLNKYLIQHTQALLILYVTLHFTSGSENNVPILKILFSSLNIFITTFILSYHLIF